MTEWWQFLLTFVAGVVSVVVIPALTARFTKKAEAAEETRRERSAAVKDLLEAHNRAIEALDAQGPGGSTEVRLNGARVDVRNAALAVVALVARRDRGLTEHLAELNEMAGWLAPRHLYAVGIELGAWARGSRWKRPVTDQPSATKPGESRGRRSRQRSE